MAPVANSDRLSRVLQEFFGLELGLDWVLDCFITVEHSEYSVSALCDVLESTSRQLPDIVFPQKITYLVWRMKLMRKAGKTLKA